MKKIFNKTMALLCVIVIIFLFSCKKQDEFLDIKRSNTDVVPTTIADFQGITDDINTMNLNFPSFAYCGIDNFYIPDAILPSFDAAQIASYLWNADIYQGSTTSFGSDWNTVYKGIECTNIALDGLAKIKDPGNDLVAYNTAKGSALFFRSYMFYFLSQLYCRAYDSSSAATDLGIVLRTTSDINVKSVRSTVKETYSQIIEDLKTAITLLPDLPAFTMRPSKASAYGALAKVYLSAGDYADALIYVNKSLAIFSTLLDYNSSTVNPAAAFPFPVYPVNPEIILFAYSQQGEGAAFVSSSTSARAIIDTVFYNSYDNNDLRKTLFYNNQGNGKVTYRGTYSGTFYSFSGIATNELLLIRAECNARVGNLQTALADLNLLLSKRYKSNTYVPFSTTDGFVLLTKILQERRKELPFTGQLRWEDLRRLNKDPRFAITLKRVYNGVTYTLPPNDLRYTYPIPLSEIVLSGIQQNPRQ